MRKRLSIQEALKRPMKLKKKLRIYISHVFQAGREPEVTFESIIFHSLKNFYSVNQIQLRFQCGNYELREECSKIAHPIKLIYLLLNFPTLKTLLQTVINGNSVPSLKVLSLNWISIFTDLTITLLNGIVDLQRVKRMASKLNVQEIKMFVAPFFFHWIINP